MADLKEELEEAKQILLKVKFPRIKAILAAHVEDLERESGEIPHMAWTLSLPWTLSLLRPQNHPW